MSQTKIFSRLLTPKDQSLVYEMSLDTPEEVAMILPLPVILGSDEKSVKFIDLSGYPDFFKDLQKGFPRKYDNMRLKSAVATLSTDTKTLEVQKVGSFEASFVPTIADFARLDPRFKLPDGTWEKIPAYANHGFAVFKLKKGNQKLHPMAFQFPSRLAAQAKLFFPTVHIHDGEIHEKEEFDHLLYAQTWLKAALRSQDGWAESEKLASQFTEVKKSKKLLWGGGHVYRRQIVGRQKNIDTLAQPIAIGS